MEGSMYVTAMILGMVLLAVGAQGAIRLVVDNADAGLLSWVPGGVVAQLVLYVAIAAAGLVMAAWGADRARKAGTLS
jgi:hypothetical protein